MRVTKVTNGFKYSQTPEQLEAMGIEKKTYKLEDLYFEMQEHESLLRYFIQLDQKSKNFLNRAILNTPTRGFELIKKFKEKQPI